MEEAKEEVETVDLELERISVDSFDEMVEIPIKEEKEPTPTAIIKKEAEDSLWDDDEPVVVKLELEAGSVSVDSWDQPNTRSPSEVPDLPEGHTWNVPTAQSLLDAAWQLHQRQEDRAEVLRRAGVYMGKAAKLMEEALALMAQKM